MFTSDKQIAELFGTYFHQDYDLMVENFDRSKPTIPQLVQGYKNDSPQEDIDEAINELKGLINEHYTSDILESLFDRWGISLDNQRLGYTNQEFLIEVLRILKGHDKEGSHNSQITEELFSKSESPEPAHVLAPGIEGMFSEYFSQSYDDLYQKYNSYRIIPLAVASYKKRVEPVAVKLSISEIERLIDKEYDEKTLKHKIFPKYGIKVEMSKLGVTYIGFLERVHEELVGKRLYY